MFDSYWEQLIRDKWNGTCNMMCLKTQHSCCPLASSFIMSSCIHSNISLYNMTPPTPNTVCFWASAVICWLFTTDLGSVRGVIPVTYYIFKSVLLFTCSVLLSWGKIKRVQTHGGQKYKITLRCRITWIQTGTSSYTQTWMVH